MKRQFNSELFAIRLSLKQQAMYMSLREASKEIGISVATLHRLTKEKFKPDIDTYFLCCQWMELPMDFFIRKTTSKP